VSLTQGGASLALGYFHTVPMGLRLGSFCEVWRTSRVRHGAFKVFTMERKCNSAVACTTLVRL
jgi:hypothetical protein